MRVIVLGAGLLGVTSAYFLQQLGHEVTVIDRQATPAAETSFANGGQISVSHAEPWANPSAPLKVLQWLGKEDAPLLFRLRADMRQWLSTEWDVAAWSESTIEHAIHGSAEQCIEQLRAHVKTGVNRIILIPYRYQPEQVERIAKEVLPKL